MAPVKASSPRGAMPYCVVLWRTAKNIGGQRDKQEPRTVVPTSWLNEARTTCRWPTFDSDENRLRNYIMKDKPLTKGQYSSSPIKKVVGYASK